MKQILLISNLVHHPDKEFYAQGSPWTQFRKKAEENLKSLTRFCISDVEWDMKCASKINWETLDTSDYDGIILSGSPYNVDESPRWIALQQKWIRSVLHKAHPPILGVCFGHQLLAKTLGGEISSTEYIQGEVPFSTTEETYITYSNHEQYVSVLPKGAEVLAYGPRNIPYMVKYALGVYGIQCHPEKKVPCALSEDFWKKTIQEIFSF